MEVCKCLEGLDKEYFISCAVRLGSGWDKKNNRTNQ
jgi:hypothetical protein